MAGDGRVEVPLRMIHGNLEILLNNAVRCEAVSLKYDPRVKHGVILVFHGADKEQAKQLGMKFHNET